MCEREKKEEEEEEKRRGGRERVGVRDAYSSCK